MKSIEVIIPAMNEVGIVGSVIRQAKSYCNKVAVVCDSLDDPCFREAQQAGARMLVNTWGKGKGCAIRYALQATDADVIVFMDADGSHEAADIPKLAEPILKGQADMVIGSRFMAGGGSEELGGSLSEWGRYCANHMSSWVTSMLLRIPLRDINHGFRAIRREVAQELVLRAKRFDIEAEMVIACARKDYRILEVSTIEKRRQHGHSRLNTTIQVWDVLVLWAKALFGTNRKLR